MKTNIKFLSVCFLFLAALSCERKNNQLKLNIHQLYKAAPKGVETRWASAENPDALKGKGAMSNKGAKGDAYTLIAPNSTKAIFDQKGAGIITKIWSANTTQWFNESKSRKVLINIYWDNAKKPAVSVPFKEFFGMALGLQRRFESALFSSPEGRSFNCFVPMPYRKAARIEIVNQSDTVLMFYYKVDFLKLPKIDKDALYLHAYWHRDIKTKRGVDFEILPKVSGKGRYLGTNIGVIGDSIYRGTWFGEGEVKIYLDGDTEYPTLAGTGTEDYIGTGWGQGEYNQQIQGSLVSNRHLDVYSFYRYHVFDPVYFHKDCRVTIQQIGNSTRDYLREMRKKGAIFDLIWSFVEKDSLKGSKRYLDMEDPPKLDEKRFPKGVSTNFYRSDDVCATAYFYLDRPENKLPQIQNLEERIKDMDKKLNPPKKKKKKDKKSKKKIKKKKKLKKKKKKKKEDKKKTKKTEKKEKEKKEENN